MIRCKRQSRKIFCFVACCLASFAAAGKTDKQLSKHPHKEPLFTAKESAKLIQVQRNLDLISASGDGDIKKMKILLSKGAHMNFGHVNKMDYREVDEEIVSADSALKAAVQANKIEAIKLLLSRGAKVNALGFQQDSITSLMMASRQGSIEIVKLLLNWGAKVNMKTNRGYTALMVATGPMYVGQGAYYEHMPKQTEISLGIYPGSAEMVKLLLAKGANVNARTKTGATALMMAIGSGRYQFVHDLVGHGGVVDLKTRDPEKTKIVRLLLRKGAQVNFRNAQGTTALMNAVRTAAAESIGLLLNTDAEANIRNKEGDTALRIAKRMQATRMQNMGVIIKLLTNAGGRE